MRTALAVTALMAPALEDGEADAERYLHDVSMALANAEGSPWVHCFAIAYSSDVSIEYLVDRIEAAELDWTGPIRVCDPGVVPDVATTPKYADPDRVVFLCDGKAWPELHTLRIDAKTNYPELDDPTGTVLRITVGEERFDSEDYPDFDAQVSEFEHLTYVVWEGGPADPGEIVETGFIHSSAMTSEDLADAVRSAGFDWVSDVSTC